MSTQLAVFQGDNLQQILSQAREHVRQNGCLHKTQRGETYSQSSVQLVWQNPTDLAQSFWNWDKAANDRYQEMFVENRPENAPEHLASDGSIVFPYTYAARSRYWDGGWGYVVAVLETIRRTGAHLSTILKDIDSFIAYLEKAGESIHLQPLLAVWDWLGKDGIVRFLHAPEVVQSLLQRSRVDQLGRIISDIEIAPTSRRAVTASFVYPQIDHRFDQIASVPPYQSFQLLPAADACEPLHSFHVHRSLDATSGIELDFHHDFRWLQHAAKRLRRPVGSITVVAADLHVYVAMQETAGKVPVEEWLMRVTDGYRTGRSNAKRLLKTELFSRNVRRIYQRLGG